MSAPLRVLHIGKYFLPAKGGIERFLADLVTAQRAAGDEVAVLVHEHDSQTRNDPSWVMRCPVWVKLLFTPISPGFGHALSRALERFEPAVLCMHMPNASVFWALLNPRARRLPWVVHWHADVEPSGTGLRLAYPIYRLFERAVLERADAIIVTSQAYLDASRPLGPWRRKCHVVPLGVDAGRLPDPAAVQARGDQMWRAGSLRVLFVGRLTYYKGLETLVAAASGAPGAEVLIAGDGEERGRIERAIRASAAGGGRVRLLGEVDDDTLGALLASCHVFALPSTERTEAFGVALLEAMRYGKPLIASQLAGSGVLEVARDGENAILVPPSDIGAWRRALGVAASSPNRLRALGERGARRFALEYDIRLAASRVRRILARSQVAACMDGDDPSQLTLDLRAESRRARAGGYLIVIPALNEAATVADVVRKARAQSGADVVVVDDGSEDDTRAQALAAGATVLRAPLWQGAWGAIQTGIRYAVRHGYAGVVTLDADGQHEPQYLPRLVAASASADVVIAACPSRGSLARHIAWGYFRLLTGFDVDDLTSGFRYYNARACRLLAGEEATLLDYQDIGVLLLLRRSGLSVAEMQVPMNPRTTGKSRVFSSWWSVASYMAETSLLCLARWGRPKGHAP